MDNYSLRRWLTVLLAFCAGNLFAQEIDESTAPWDFRDARYASQQSVIEQHHFNRDVQMLVRGQSGTHPGPDLEFMFRYFPNHHGALNVMGRLWRHSSNVKGGIPPGLTSEKSANYYFERAIEFAPDDAVVHMLFGMHLYSSGNLDRALIEYKIALDLEPESPELNYNIGLYYHSVEAYVEATKHAKFAYENGYPLPGLRKKLMSIGAWDGSID